MPTEQNKLYLYEALELRAEYDARIKTLRDCLPDTRRNRDRIGMYRTDEQQLRAADDFDVAAVQESLRALEHKRRKLNNAIQRANYAHTVSVGGEAVDLSEALEMRKGLSDRIGELHTQSVQSAYVRVIYKEDRDIVEPNDATFVASMEQLESARREFRRLNRALRAASFTAAVEFADE